MSEPLPDLVAVTAAITVDGHTLQHVLHIDPAQWRQSRVNDDTKAALILEMLFSASLRHRARHAIIEAVDPIELQELPE